MSASTSTPSPKKPPASSSATASSDRRTTTTTSSSTLNRSPSRMAAAVVQSPSAALGTVNGSANRTRSVRNGASTPISARAAARKPAVAMDAEDDAKAELQIKLEELQERLQHAEYAWEESRKHADVLQIKLDEALKEQSMLEESVHEHTERVEELEMEKRESLRARRELEQIYEAERVQSMKEREEAAAEKDELAQNMQRLRETFAQRELRERAGIDDERRPSVSRTSSLRSEDASPGTEGRRDSQFAPPSSLQRSDSRSSSRLVLQKDKLIESLRLELAEAQIKNVELENKGGGKLHQLEKDMYDIKMQNARLMEENESFHLLLSEKTLNGDLVQSELLRPPSHGESHSRPSSSAKQKSRTSLAEELEGMEADFDLTNGDSPPDTVTKALRTEVASLKDSNKALTLYINNIISRLLQHEQFEAILDKTPDLMAGPGALSRKYAAQQTADADVQKDLPPPPPPHQSLSDDGQQPQGFLSRAGSVLRRKQGRPVSQIQPTAALPPRPSIDLPEESTVHHDPSTAPSIPLGRSASTRAHRRSRSEWPGAASVVTNMYKGPSPGAQGPMSPGLGANPARASYFASTQARVPSGGAVPTIADLDRDKENQPQAPPLQPRDSKFSSLGASPELLATREGSSRNSFMSNPGDRPDLTDLATPAESSNPSSPPRSTTSSGDRERPTGAIMMGSRPRPLRLVQEADEDRARKQANRASWFGGWAQAGSFGGFLPGRAGGNEGQQQQH